MSRSVSFRLPGPVTPWARPGARAIVGRPKRPGGKPPTWIQWYTDGDVEQYQRRVVAAFAEACGLQPLAAVPLAVTILAVEPRQQAAMRRADNPGLIPSIGPRDVDNFAKVVLDALQRCALCCGSRAGRKGCGCRVPRPMISDDKLVSWLEAHKARAEVADRQAKRSAEPRLYCTVWQLDEATWRSRLAVLFPGLLSGPERW